ncbi:amidohydrolase family protein [Cumulibacter manganitolerans]|uniref:amidohydrolase family protein n=1 Tax=Cumulibacter manganitolerans TaxID=1884992 RepID=UPI001295A807|nr:amidohydrolase family protein [Cumulibacter manganitolerans]
MAYTWDDAFLATQREAALEPELPIIDPHHHLWDAPGLQPYLVPQLHADTGAGHNVLATVFIDCVWDYRRDGPPELRALGETERAAQAAAESRGGDGAVIGGIVSYVDMSLGARAGAVLDAHVAAGDGLFRGIRHATAFADDPAVHRSHTKPTPGLMREPAFHDGVRELAARDLTFDAWLYFDQLAELAELARDVPAATMVLDHLGGPLGVGRYADDRDGMLAAWRSGIADVARCENVHVKLGGIGMKVYGIGFDQRPTAPSSDELVAAWGEPIRYLIEQFGPDRCMFESNFPVDRESTGYVVLWNAFKKIAADYSPSERDALFRGTAERVYRVDGSRR